MNSKWYAITAVVVIVVAAVAAFGGYSYGLQQGQLRASDIRNQFLAARGLGGNGAQAGGGQGFGGQGATGTGNRQFNANNFANGQVKSISGDTIQLSTATEVLTVKLTSQTQIEKMGQGSASDIQAGERITIQGTRASDGSFTAQNIQIGNRGFGGAGGPPAGAGSGVPGANATPQAPGTTAP